MSNETKRVMAAKAILLGTAAITKACSSINRRGKALDRDIQIAAVSCLNHVEQHGDVTVIATLLDAMPQGSRANSLKRFINTFGKVVYDKPSKSFVYDRAGTTDLEGAMSIMWTEFKPEPEYRPIDVISTLNKLLTRIEKDKKTVYDADLVDGLRKLVTVEPNH